jgi:hypothetical protein
VPYRTPGQTAPLEERRDFDTRGFWIWSRDDTLRYFLAGGGVKAEFEAPWASVTRRAERFETAIAERTYPADARREIHHLHQGGSPLA